MLPVTKLGIVYFVGAGPGDPELITVRGLRLIKQADVLVHDRLVSLQLLKETSPRAQRINVGKTPGQQQRQQVEINALLIAEARRGKTIVRLKGGDPFVFGRGAEECQALTEAGIPFEITPGVTSATAVPAYAGIPVTHRDVASSFTVVAGYTRGPDSVAVDWEWLAHAEMLVFLMGVHNLPEIAQRLVQHGLPSETPAAVIHWGTTTSQIVVEGTLTDIAEKAKGIPPPAIIMVGQIVNLRQQLTWFDPAEGHKPPIPSSREEPQPDGSGEGENERLKPTTLEIL